MPEQMPIHTEYIELAQLLKLADIAGTGGEAKMIIQDGEVQVNDELETRRGRKLRPGDKVRYGKREIEVVAG